MLISRKRRQLQQNFVAIYKNNYQCAWLVKTCYRITVHTYTVEWACFLCVLREPIALQARQGMKEFNFYEKDDIAARSLWPSFST